MNNQNTELMEIFMGLSQVTRCCRQDVAFYEGVTFHQFMILDAVAEKKEMQISDLHKLLAVEKSTTTRLVNPLIKKGLIKIDYDAFRYNGYAELSEEAIKMLLPNRCTG